MDECRDDAITATFTVEDVNGSEYDPSHPGTEASINVQYAQGMTYPTPLIYYSNGGEAIGEDEPEPGDMWLEWLNYVLDKPNILQTISTYGGKEMTLALGYTTALCKLFAQLGARGVSVFFASDNHRVGDGDCKTKDGRVQFIPTFPASCTCGVLSLVSSTHT